MYSHEEYIRLILSSDNLIAGPQNFNSQDMEEDTRMLAFFDSLVQREISGSSSEEEDDDEDNPFRLLGETLQRFRREEQRNR